MRWAPCPCRRPGRSSDHGGLSDGSCEPTRAQRDGRPALSTYQEQFWSFVLDAACREIAARLDECGHDFVMLKGATIASWLYDDPASRTYTDLDVLVSPESQAAVIEDLRGIGYRPLLDPATVLASSPEEQPLANESGVLIDLHVTLKGSKAGPGATWAALSRRTVPFDWAGTPVRCLAPPARALHLALHAANGGLADGKAARDLALGIEKLDPGLWREAAELAREIRAEEAFAAGLALLPEGRAVAARLGLGPVQDRETVMRAGSASHSALVLQQTLAATSWRQAAGRIRAHVFPSVEWMRLYQPEDATTPGRLLLARVRRPLTLLRRLPAAHLERRRFRRGS